MIFASRSHDSCRSSKFNLYLQGCLRPQYGIKQIIRHGQAEVCASYARQETTKYAVWATPRRGIIVNARGAISNGLSEAEVYEALLQVVVYVGMPAGLEGFWITIRKRCYVRLGREGCLLW